MNTICPFFNKQSSNVLWWFWRIYWVSFIFLKKEAHYTIGKISAQPHTTLCILDAKIFFHLHCVAFLKILGFFYCLIFSLCDYLVDSHKRNHFIGRKTEDIVELSKSWRTGWRGQNTNWTNEVYIYFNLWCYDFVLWVDSPSKSRLDFETFGPVREMDQSSFEAFETFWGIKFHDVWNHSRNNQVKFFKISRRGNRANCTHIYPNPQFCPDRKLRKSL